jgi:hypothetical protein
MSIGTGGYQWCHVAVSDGIEVGIILSKQLPRDSTGKNRANIIYSKEHFNDLAMVLSTPKDRIDTINPQEQLNKAYMYSNLKCNMKMFWDWIETSTSVYCPLSGTIHSIFCSPAQ